MAGYGTNEGFTAYATAAGYTVPSGDVAQARQRGSTYIDGAYGGRFVGVPTDGVDQERAWPRTGATAFGNALSTTLIPVRVINASYEAALLELKSPGSLSTTVDPAKRVKREKVDVIEREFFDPADLPLGGILGPVTSTIEGLLAPLLMPDTGDINVGIWSVG